MLKEIYFVYEGKIGKIKHFARPCFAKLFNDSFFLADYIYYTENKMEIHSIFLNLTFFCSFHSTARNQNGCLLFFQSLSKTPKIIVAFCFYSNTDVTFSSQYIW